MSAAAGNRRRLASLRSRVEVFAARNLEQRRLKGFLLAMMGVMEADYCGPGEEEEFERWWRVVVRYRRVLESRRLAGKKRAEFLAEVFEGKREGRR